MSSRYCECYQANVECTSACKCTDCKNCGSHGKEEEEEDYCPPVTKKASARSKAGAGNSKPAAPAVTEKPKANNKRGASAISSTADELQSSYKRHSSLAASGGSGSTATTSRSQRDRSHQHRELQKQQLQLVSGSGGDEEQLQDVHPNKSLAVSPATSSSNGLSQSSSSASGSDAVGGVGGPTPRTRTSFSVNVRAQAQASNGSFSLGGRRSTGSSFQQQLAAHQAEQHLKRGASKHSSATAADPDALETDPDLTSCDNSLQEPPTPTPAAFSSSLQTPVKRGTKRPAHGVATGLSALETLVEIASPSPRAQHSFANLRQQQQLQQQQQQQQQSQHLQQQAVPLQSSRLTLSRQGFLSSAAALSPVSPMSVSLGTVATPTNKRRVLSYVSEGGVGRGVGGAGAAVGSLSGASPMPPVFSSPLRLHSQPSSQLQVGSPFAVAGGLSSSPTPTAMHPMPPMMHAQSHGLRPSPYTQLHHPLTFASSPLLFQPPSALSSMMGGGNRSGSSNSGVLPSQRVLTPVDVSASSDDLVDTALRSSARTQGTVSVS